MSQPRVGPNCAPTTTRDRDCCRVILRGRSVHQARTVPDHGRCEVKRHNARTHRPPTHSLARVPVPTSSPRPARLPRRCFPFTQKGHPHSRLRLAPAPLPQRSFDAFNAQDLLAREARGEQKQGCREPTEAAKKRLGRAYNPGVSTRVHAGCSHSGAFANIPHGIIAPRNTPPRPTTPSSAPRPVVPASC